MLKKKNIIYYETILTLFFIYIVISVLLSFIPWASEIFGLIFLFFVVLPSFVVEKKTIRLPIRSYFLIIILPLANAMLIAFINAVEPNFWRLSYEFNELLALSISAGLLAPVLEELLMRGLLLEEQLEFQSKRKAIIINTLFFFLLHLDLLSLFHLVAAFLLAVSYVKYRSIRLNILIHFATNITSLSIRWAGYFNRIDIYNLSVFAITSIVILFIVFTWLKTKIFKHSANTSFN